VEETTWDEKHSVWRLRIKSIKDGTRFSHEADVVLTAIGRFNAWKIPDYPGIKEYKGLLRHASDWEPSFDASGKKIAVIGNGASGIQLVANIQKHAQRLDHYARNKTWISASWAGDERTFEPQPFSDADKVAFKDSEQYIKLRKDVEDKYWRRFRTFFRDSPENIRAKEHFIKILKERTAKKPELFDRLLPDFSPNCRRLTPGPGYLEALTEDNVNYIQTPIKRFTETGIETEDGIHREVDAVFAATGANIDMAPPFSINAFGKDLKKAWRKDGEYGFPYTYLGLAVPKFPNLFLIHGAHGTGPSGTVPHSVEVQLTYYAKVLRKISREGIKTITPSQKAADDFQEYSTAFFAKTALTDHCSSWYNGGKPGGRIHGIWPGSAAHVTIVRREPRWEDYEYEYLSSSGNRFAWYFGNGWTKREQDLEADITSYLQVPSSIDLRQYHESWWKWP
jgi:cation diffusion facilitator CzcD-associated flavoprotein CzcO